MLSIFSLIWLSWKKMSHWYDSKTNGGRCKRAQDAVIRSSNLKPQTSITGVLLCQPCKFTFPYLEGLSGLENNDRPPSIMYFFKWCYMFSQKGELGYWVCCESMFVVLSKRRCHSFEWYQTFCGLQYPVYVKSRWDNDSSPLKKSVLKGLIKSNLGQNVDLFSTNVKFSFRCSLFNLWPHTSAAVTRASCAGLRQSGASTLPLHIPEWIQWPLFLILCTF